MLDTHDFTYQWHNSFPHWAIRFLSTHFQDLSRSSSQEEVGEGNQSGFVERITNGHDPPAPSSVEMFKWPCRHHISEFTNAAHGSCWMLQSHKVYCKEYARKRTN
eukprot:s1216_g10.t1